MDTITSKGRKLAAIIREEDMGQGLSFFTDASDFIQVGSWRYPAGQVLAAHNHATFERTAERTQEAVIVLRGRVLLHVYDEDDAPVTSAEVGSGEVAVLFAGGHGYEVLTDDTLVVEAKNGPYAGPQADRRRLEESQTAHTRENNA